MKVIQAKFKETELEGIFQIYCPGCKSRHSIDTVKPNPLGHLWTFNGDMEKPTFTPSVNISWESGSKLIARCHFIITDGIIHYCPDCTHPLVNQKVELPDVPNPEKS